MKKKGDKAEMHPIEREAKMRSLGELHKMAQDMLGEKLHGLKKVSVMAPNEEGLEEGLHKAEELVKKGPKSLGHHEAIPFAGEETPEEEAAEEKMEEEHPEEAAHMMEEHEEEPQSEEEIDQKIQELMEKKARLAKK